ncbi:hypothetical protein C6A40_24630, partial [Enterobacter sp. GER_MD16_1505_Eko_090]
PAYGPQNDVTLKMPAFEWVHVQLHQQKGMISLSPPTICNSAVKVYRTVADNLINVMTALYATVDPIDIVRFQTSPHRLVFFGRTLRGIKWSCLTHSIQAH